MRTVDLLKNGLVTLRINRRQALQAMLGIVIGILFVILLVSIGRSVERVIIKQINDFGSRTIILFPGTGNTAALIPDKFGGSLTFGDAESVARVPLVTSVAPVIFFAQTVRAGHKKDDPLILGTNENLIPANVSGTITRGRLLSRDDVERRRPVALLGWDVAEKLFGASQALGEKVTIGNNSFTVIGVLASQGTQIFQNPDERVYIPLSIAKTMMNSQYYNMIALQATGDMQVTVQELRSLLRRRHVIENPQNDPEKDDFYIQSPAEASNIVGPITSALTILLSLVASVSLIVGGIGIMNIMMASVKKRTREIGLRKALGAKDRDLLLQFLFEAALLTEVGGLIGILLGVTLSFLASLVARLFLADWAFILPLWSVVGSFLLSMGVGMVFGILPARRAAQLEPIEALRYE